MTLWQWSQRYDRWDWTAECLGDAEQRRKILRGHKRRSATGAKFKWVVGDEPPRKYRQRAAKEVSDEQ